VHVYSNGAAHEVDFVDGDGTTVACITIDFKDVRTIDRGELLHTLRHVDRTNNPMDRSGGLPAS